MFRSNHTSNRRGLAPTQDKLGAVRLHMAEAMIGRTVDLLADMRTIAHGVVTGVLSEAGMPKIVVDGRKYDLNQVLTVTPAGLNP